MSSVEYIVRKYADQISDSRIWFAPDIPSNKLQSALRSYATDVSPNEVLMLVDETLFGGCKDGMLITHRKIYAHQFLEAPKSIEITSIKSVEMKNKDGTFSASKLIVNDEKWLDLAIIDRAKNNHIKLYRLMSELSSPGLSFDVIGENAHQINKECPGCGAPASHFDRVCSYCGRAF